MENSFANQCSYSAETVFNCVLPQFKPIGIFWDIENIQVPFNRSAIKLVERIRRIVVERQYRETDFQVVCDISKANKQVIEDLNSSQVTVIHISSTAKNAADDKIKQLIHRFIQTNGYLSAVLVITDDVNFACVLSDLKYHFRVDIILIQRQASPALKNSANSVIDFKELCEGLPLRSNTQTKESLVLVTNIPTDRKPSELKKWISKLCANCGGKKISLNICKGEATIRFGCLSDARRAQQRIDRQDIFGKTIKATVDSVESNTDSSDTSEEPSPPEDELMARFRQRKNSQPTHDLQINELLPYCSLHSNAQSPVITNGSNNKSLLPSVNISIQLLAKRVHKLLDTHGGTVPLKSFIDCYTKEFHELFDTTDKSLIGLEHLITCVPGVCISTAPANLIKRVTWIPNHDRYLPDDNSEPQSSKIVDQRFATQLQHFGKEVRELLKSQPHSTVPFSKFVPTYHNHFVRQLCVGHYGCQKLSELLEEIPHIVQIYGDNDSRMITLTHREQTKRFANDLIKVLKTQNGRRIKLSEFAAAYQQLFDKPFDVCDYGVCYLEDILRDVWEGTVMISSFGTNDKWIELPKRDRSSDHKRRTVVFAQEVIELLNRSKEVVDFQLTFSKFIPCYHRYYNKQCRVSDYGFVKLIELLEELSPKVVEIGTDDKFGEKNLRLNYDNRLKALISRFESILKQLDGHSTTVSNLEVEYNRKFKSKIDFNEYYAKDLIDLIDKMPNNKFRIIQTKAEMKIVLLDSNHFRTAAKRVARILMEEINTELSNCELEIRYLEEYGQSLDTHIFGGEFSDVFIIDSNQNSVRLTELFHFCRDCILCMQSAHRKKFTVDELDRELIRCSGQPLPQPTYYKCRSICELFTKFFDFFRIEKRKTCKDKSVCLLSLDQQYIKKPLVMKEPVYQILKRPKPAQNNSTLVASLDIDKLLTGDVPESLPLPDLVPNHSSLSDDTDLINWSTEVSDECSDDGDSRRQSPDLMSFNDSDFDEKPNISEKSAENQNCWTDSFDTTTGATVASADETHSNTVFKITNGFTQKKSRIVANFS